MPYIIETTRPDATGYCGESPQSRRAVATLEDARRAVESHALIDGFAQFDVYQYGTLGTNGGTIGPLRDGTVITVERVQWDDFYMEVPTPLADAVDPKAAAIAAYNRRQGGN